MNKKTFSKSLLSVALLVGLDSANAETYSITEVGQFDGYRQHFAVGLNNNGEIVGVVRDSFNFPFYSEEYLSDEDVPLKDVCELSDTEIATGNFDSDSALCVKSELSRVARGTEVQPSYGVSANYQKIGDSRAFTVKADAAELITMTDVIDPELGDYTRSTIEQFSAINDAGIAVGSTTAPFLPVEFTPTVEGKAQAPVTQFVREYNSRATIYRDGTLTLIEPDEATYGGVSYGTDISNTGFVAGYQSIAIKPDSQSTVDTNCTGESLPVEACIWANSRSGNFYETNATIWQLDLEGAVVGKVVYPISFEPEEGNDNVYQTVASAVNDNGVAVGFGHAQLNSSSSFINLYPMVFENGETKPLISDHADFIGGFALDINNNGLVIGRILTSFQGDALEQFFVFDRSTNILETPTSFFNTAKSSANSVNDQGIVVGEAEYETSQSSVRRKHGFIYDSITKEFKDINDHVACGSAYEIVEMKSINNNGQIVATALKKVDKRDAFGEVILDENGTAEQEEVAVAILLNKTSEEIPGECPEEQEPDYKRKGLSQGIFGTLLLSGLVAIRRRFI